MSVVHAELSPAEHRQLLYGLQRHDCYDHPVSHMQLVETHISSVILTGTYAYKLKKPVDLGFLDFSTLAKRKFCCAEELRLNRRLAPQLYLDVKTIGGSLEHPVMGGDDPVIDYAIRMREFAQSAQLDRLLKNNGLHSAHIDQLAETIAQFHQQAARAEHHTDYGDPEQIQQPVEENFAQIRRIIHEPELLTRLDRPAQWCQQRFAALTSTFIERKQQGYIRECHGDMHLRNMVLLDDTVVLFDCIEFNPQLRWIDTISDIAFLVMDLEDRLQAPLARRFLNRYLELSGDYAGVAVLDYYKVYRAMVRAKVAAIRLAQQDVSESDRQAAMTDLHNYLDLAERDSRTTTPALLLTRGVSGSGKTFYSQQILEQADVIRLRSDVERLRLYPDTAPQERYSTATSDSVYAHLYAQADLLLQHGQRVIVDATFLDNDRFAPFVALAAKHNLPLTILEFTAAESVLARRIAQRHTDASEATIDIMRQQLQTRQALPANLQPCTITLNTEQEINIESLCRQLFKD
ncbi:MAG: AAA family ATPase [Gammaproteobacteria bacterium]|nr:AAA family ATPase [Gammaproteobacteria bacterium]MDH5651042.1 AAA family ATPase [Gammaproteobacteria bacterium]